MSRSRRAPVWTDGLQGHSKRRRFNKNQANRRIRRTEEEIANGRAYRRFYNPYDICDYKFREGPYFSSWGENGPGLYYPKESWKVNRK